MTKKMTKKKEKMKDDQEEGEEEADAEQEDGGQLPPVVQSSFYFYCYNFAFILASYFIFRVVY
jgi:hypothetical protein